MSVVMVTKDAAGLKDKLVSDVFSPITYDAGKPKALLDEDEAIGGRKPNTRPEAITITSATAVFAK